jgi:cytochrome oxidase Cu insertion factor (SCO1/SenC/PrrC family)
MQSNQTGSKGSNRKNLLWVLAAFALPSIIATTMYVSGWRPSATGNHGILIQPARFIEERAMKSMDGNPVLFSELKGKWTMVYFDRAGCSELCLKQLFVMRQTHIAQGKDQERVQRLFILTDNAGAETLQTKLSEFPDMRVWMADKLVMSKLTQDFGWNTQNEAENKGIYLLDPQGNLMMRYVPDAEPAGLRKDLAKLLKYSSDK